MSSKCIVRFYISRATFDKRHCASIPREDDGEGDLEVAVDNGKKRSYSETSRMFKLRRNLDQLDSFYRQKEHDMLKARFGPDKTTDLWLDLSHFKLDRDPVPL